MQLWAGKGFSIVDNNLKVLIADDTADVLERLAVMIRRIDRVNVVGLAKNTPEAISLFDAQNPDVVILDIQMPGGSGLEVLHYIKLKRPEVTVLMMTNSPYPEYRAASMRGGADFFMDKSHGLTGIIEMISDLARRPINSEAG